MKLTHSKTASRRAHHSLGVPSLVKTATGVRRRHFVDPSTGMYRGKQIIAVGSGDSAPKSPKTEDKGGKVAKEASEKAASAKEK